MYSQIVNTIDMSNMCSHRYKQNTLIIHSLDHILHIMFALFIYNLISYLCVVLFGGLNWKILILKININIISMMILIYKIYVMIYDSKNM